MCPQILKKELNEKEAQLNQEQEKGKKVNEEKAKLESVCDYRCTYVYKYLQYRVWL